jgi:hypothetical protein
MWTIHFRPHHLDIYTHLLVQNANMAGVRGIRKENKANYDFNDAEP